VTVSDPVSGRALADARSSIESLRRRYAQAVDSISRGGPLVKEAAGREFRSIFAPDAVIRFVVAGKTALHAVGPDAWAVIVGDAVGKYLGTQHLIGTQVVRFGALESADDGRIVAGEASMISHVQASHWTDRRLRVVLGDYHDKVRFDTGAGWRIHAMDLVQHFRWEQALSTD
jgi:hypothetical protein